MSNSIFHVRPLDSGKGWAIDEYDGRGAWQRSVPIGPDGAPMDGFDLIVGMHPDGATDCILEGAARYGALAVISPCCVRPNAWTYWGNKQSRRMWHEHLLLQSARRGLALQVGNLKMTGANTVMWGQR